MKGWMKQLYWTIFKLSEMMKGGGGHLLNTTSILTLYLSIWMASHPRNSGSSDYKKGHGCALIEI